MVKKPRIKKVWHHYLRWEDYANGMWRTVSGDERAEFLKNAIRFTGNHELYGYFMERVINEWPVSCEHNLTDLNSNRRAWLGHAAVCLAFGCPEDITREAWGHLSEEQQIKADAQADKFIQVWETMYEEKNLGIHSEVGKPRVS